MIKKLFFQVAGLFLFLAVTLISPSMTSAALQGQNALNTQLLNLAQKKLNAEYDVLITGDSTKLTANAAVATLATQQVNDVVTTQIRRNKILAEHGQKYTKATSILAIEKTDIQGSQATITAKEQVTLTLIDKNSPDPVYTKEEKEHVFHYSLQGKKWNLVGDDVANPFTPVKPETGAQKVSEKPIDITFLKKTEPQSIKAEDVFGQAAPIVTAMTGTFNPTNAVNYARSYWNNYNGAYRKYGNDCTNFISQAMNWSGWQHNGGWYDDPHYWWYSNSPIAQWGGRAEARSWINVHYFYFFGRNQLSAPLSSGLE